VLGISQSGVSHTIASLERTLGASVLERRGLAATATAFGELILEDARTALIAAESIMGHAVEPRTPQLRRLRLRQRKVSP
jgi:DNA-binding transcriptional LysR family regulator